MELRGDSIAGLAVHIGARIADLAEPSQVLVSGTVREDRLTLSGPPRSRSFGAGETCEDEVVEQVRRTVIHEVGHHFGIDDDRLHQLRAEGRASRISRADQAEGHTHG